MEMEVWQYEASAVEIVPPSDICSTYMFGRLTMSSHCMVP